jgi:hypothetical protein
LISAIIVELFPDGIKLRQGRQPRGERRADLVVEVLAQARVELLLLVVVAVVLGLVQQGSQRVRQALPVGGFAVG